MSVLSRKIFGKELLNDGAAWTAGKLIFPERRETHLCVGPTTALGIDPVTGINSGFPPD